MSNLAQQVHLWGSWRAPLRRRTLEFAKWLRAVGLMDAELQANVDRIVEGIEEDKLRIVVVGEVSRGKSELINAIFASDKGRRLLPSFPGRSTMCPTELYWNPAEPPSIRLLPIETRAEDTPLSEFRRRPELWHTIAVEPDDAQQVTNAFKELTATKQVTREEARRYLLPEADTGHGMDDNPNAVLIPRWRHAIVNLPHPLLANGVVILDTPGLNAIGTEPELTLNMIPSAHVLLFVLAIDTGVTKSDLEAWRNHLAPVGGQRTTHFLVLNKVDMLWNGLHGEEEIASFVRRQIDYVSGVLRVDPDAVIPLSATQGLVASVIGDQYLLSRSGLPRLQSALVDQLMPSRRRDMLREAVQGEFAALVTATRRLLESRDQALRNELSELTAIRENKRELLLPVLERARTDKGRFDRALADFQQYRSRLAQLSNELFAHIGMDALEAEARATLAAMTGSHFSPGLRKAMRDYFTSVNSKLERAEETIERIEDFAGMMYARCSRGLDVSLDVPPRLSLRARREELAQVEEDFRRHFDRLSTMITYEHLALTRRFFKTVASRVRQSYRLANIEAAHWLRTLAAPAERQISQRQSRLRYHLQTLKGLQDRSYAIEEQITDLEAARHKVREQIEEVRRFALGAEDRPVVATT